MTVRVDSSKEREKWKELTGVGNRHMGENQLEQGISHNVEYMGVKKQDTSSQIAGKKKGDRWRVVARENAEVYAYELW